MAFSIFNSTYAIYQTRTPTLYSEKTRPPISDLWENQTQALKKHEDDIIDIIRVALTHNRITCRCNYPMYNFWSGLSVVGLSPFWERYFITCVFCLSFFFLTVPGFQRPDQMNRPHLIHSTQCEVSAAVLINLLLLVCAIAMVNYVMKK